MCVVSSAASSDLCPDHAGLRMSGSIWASERGRVRFIIGGLDCSSCFLFCVCRMYLNASKMSSNEKIAPDAAPKAIPIFAPLFRPLFEVADPTVGVGEERPVVIEEEPVVKICVNTVGLAEVEGTEVVEALLEDLEVAEDEADVVGPVAEVRSCSALKAAMSSHFTLNPVAIGKDMMLVSTEASSKATVLEVSGHQHGEGVGIVTVVPPSSSQAIH